MSKSDHEFKRRFIDADFNHDEKKKLAEEEKLANFAWEDDEDNEENDEAVPFHAPIEDIDSCVSKLIDFLFKRLGPDQFEGMDTEGVYFSVPIDLSLDSLLHERFSDEWTLESRLMMFQRIRNQLLLEFSDSEQRSKLDQIINKALPSTHRKKFTSGNVEIHDDAFVVNESSDMVTIEVPVHFVTNS